MHPLLHEALCTNKLYYNQSDLGEHASCIHTNNREEERKRRKGSLRSGAKYFEPLDLFDDPYYTLIVENNDIGNSHYPYAVKKEETQAPNMQA